MVAEPSLDEINLLLQSHALKGDIVNVRRLSGTTDGLVLRLDSGRGDKYILKYDDPEQIGLVEQLLTAYQESPLLPKVLFTARDKSHFAYTFTPGTTHMNRGHKKDWLPVLVKELLNRYTEVHDSKPWGRPAYPRRSWREFHEISVEEARINIGNALPKEDYEWMKALLQKWFDNDRNHGGKYLLHGDTGVHNFVFHESQLAGVIDPSPMTGPLIYDFSYAFCSSPDDLHTDTLFAAYDLLEHGRIERPRLIDEVLIQLYCRIGLCRRHHPDDLPEYLQAWKHWRGSRE